MICIAGPILSRAAEWICDSAPEPRQRRQSLAVGVSPRMAAPHARWSGAGHGTCGVTDSEVEGLRMSLRCCSMAGRVTLRDILRSKMTTRSACV